MSMGLMNIISQLNVYQCQAGSDWEFLNPILKVLGAALVPILIFVATAGMIYAVVLGVKLARAETTEQRDEAKKRLINAVIALVVMIALILLLEIFVNHIGDWIGGVANPDEITEIENNGTVPDTGGTGTGGTGTGGAGTGGAGTGTQGGQ